MVHALLLSAVTVTNAWSRPATSEGVVYATIENRGRSADTVVGVSSPIARSAELHETMTGMQGMVSMQRLAHLAVPAHGYVTLAPGTYHVMLELIRPIRARQSFPITFRFEHAPSVTAKVQVRQP
jgi:copper(I)-binding protein